MKECAKCGNKLKDDQVFCNKCGTKWEDPELIRLAKEAEEAEKLAVIKAAEEKARQEEEDERRRIAERDAIAAAKQQAKQDKIRSRLEKSAQKDAGKKEKAEIRLSGKEAGNLQDMAGNTGLAKAGRILRYVYLALAILFCIALTASKPSFPASEADISVYKVSALLSTFIIFVLPGLLITFDSFRSKVPFFKEKKFLQTLIGWVFCILLGLIAMTIVEAQHTDEFRLAQERYRAEQSKIDSEQEAPPEGNEDATNEEITKEPEASNQEAEGKVAEQPEPPASNQEASPAKYLIEEGKLGTTGKSEVVDGKEYIYHYIPAGTYSVKSESDSSMFFIVKDKMIKNSSGYMESVTVSSHRVSKGGEDVTVEIKSDERLIIVINSILEFTRR